jgi:hypothetical protein
MSNTKDHAVNSAWTLEVDISKGQIRRVRNFKTADGVAALPLEKKLRDVFMGIAGLAEMGGDEFSATAIENKAEELAYGWARVAQENEKVRLVLRWLVETNAWTDAAVPTVIVGGAIAWKYNLIPDKIGEPIAKFSGAVPMTPDEELELAQKMADMKAAAESTPPASETEPVRPVAPDVPTPSDGPSVVPLPHDADIRADS